MVGTMLPIGYGERKAGRKAPRSLLAYAFGSLAGSATLGLAIGILGRLLPWSPDSRLDLGFAVTGTVALAYGLSDALGLTIPRPQLNRQVPLHWSRRFRPEVFGFLYGLVLGFGVATRLSASTFFILPIWTLLHADVLSSVLVFAAFGIGRLSPALAIGPKRAADGDSLEVLIRGIEEWEPIVKFGNGVLLMFLAGYLLAGLS
jgi:hypothetical protein